jgi:thiamine biosynthesis lipoprotein
MGAAGNRRISVPSFEWRGTALGADARIVLFDTNRDAAQQAIGACLTEIERLEQSFSLYRADSELARLNRFGRLEHLSFDLRRLLEICVDVHARSAGLFDPTVQPLWSYYARWFARNRIDEQPSEHERRRMLARIGLERLEVGAAAAKLAAGTQITLNGVAQGYITDRVAELLRDRGWSNVLIDLGELRALEGRPGGDPFAVHLREPGLALALANAALATSSAATLVFSAPQSLAHILHPRTGLTPAHWSSLTVRHPSATIADALSTALFLADADELARIIGRFAGTSVWATDPTGVTRTLAA